jgi:hypothetical protein
MSSIAGESFIWQNYYKNNQILCFITYYLFPIYSDVFDSSFSTALQIKQYVSSLKSYERG